MEGVRGYLNIIHTPTMYHNAPTTTHTSPLLANFCFKVCRLGASDWLVGFVRWVVTLLMPYTAMTLSLSLLFSFPFFLFSFFLFSFILFLLVLLFHFYSILIIILYLFAARLKNSRNPEC